jgi:hypothetical protein
MVYCRCREVVKLFRFLLSPYSLTGSDNNVHNYIFCWGALGGGVGGRGQGHGKFMYYLGQSWYHKVWDPHYEVTSKILLKQLKCKCLNTFFLSPTTLPYKESCGTHDSWYLTFNEVMAWWAASEKNAVIRIVLIYHTWSSVICQDHDMVVQEYPLTAIIWRVHNLGLECFETPATYLVITHIFI